MNKKILSKKQPLVPYINEDGWYCQCIICWNEVKPKDDICPNCCQAQDWSWFGKGVISNRK